MPHEITVIEAPARPTAVVAATTTWQAFPTVWRGLVYGPHRDDPAEVWTEVYWLLR